MACKISSQAWLPKTIMLLIKIGSEQACDWLRKTPDPFPAAAEAQQRLASDKDWSKRHQKAEKEWSKKMEAAERAWSSRWGTPWLGRVTHVGSTRIALELNAPGSLLLSAQHAAPGCNMWLAAVASQAAVSGLLMAG